MADNQNSVNYFGLQDWWGGLTEMDRAILDEVFKQKSQHGQKHPQRASRAVHRRQFPVRFAHLGEQEPGAAGKNRR